MIDDERNGRVGQAWAQEWERTDRSFGALTDRLLEPAAVGAFSAALDIGCGAGELMARLAPRHPAAAITGIDISDELLAVARHRCAALPNARFETADAASWTPRAAFRPDLLISRHGVMFFADPAAAFAHLRTLAAPGALLRFSCFRSRAANEWAGALTAGLPATEADPHEPGPFAFGDEARVAAILDQAGWGDIGFEAFDYAMIGGLDAAGGGGALDEALAYFQRIGPAARALAALRDDERGAAVARLRRTLAGYHRDGAVALPAAAWLVAARAP
jgi:SAM-dependent methyltransferase